MTAKLLPAALLLAFAATCVALAILLRVDWENRQLAKGLTV